MSDTLTKAVIMLLETKCANYSPEKVIAFVSALKELPEDRVLAAITKSIYLPDDFVSVGKIVALMEEKKSGKTAASEAWAIVYDCACRGKFPKEPLILEGVLGVLGGIHILGTCESEFERSSMQRRFCDWYAERWENRHKMDAPRIAGEEAFIQVEGGKEKLRAMIGGIGRDV